MMKVFWSWQNDFQPNENRHFIKRAIEKALVGITEKIDVEDANRPSDVQIDHDTKDTPGMGDIAAIIFSKISDAAVFIADVTPIAATIPLEGKKPKALPNPNVMIELGYALHNPGHEQVIAVINLASGYKPDDLPFDLRNRRLLDYNLINTADANQKKKTFDDLVKDLQAAITVNLTHLLKEKAKTTKPTRKDAGVSANPLNRSFWSASSRFDVDAGGRERTLFIPNSPRGYTRLIPVSWPKGIPHVRKIDNLSDKEKIYPLWAPNERNGENGLTENGQIFYWFTEINESEVVAKNVTAFFEETGEFWILNGDVTWEHNEANWFDAGRVFLGWASSMIRGYRLLNKLEASTEIEIELGVTDIKKSRWNMPNEHGTARKPGFFKRRRSSNWDRDEQIDFIFDCYNNLRDCFSLPPAEKDTIIDMWIRAERHCD